MSKLDDKFKALMEEIKPTEPATIVDEAVGSPTQTKYTSGEQSLSPAKEKTLEKAEKDTLSDDEIFELKALLQIVRQGRKDFLIHFLDQQGNINSINTFMIDKTSGIKSDYFVVRFMGKPYNINYDTVVKVYEPYRLGYMQVLPAPKQVADVAVEPATEPATTSTEPLVDPTAAV